MTYPTPEMEQRFSDWQRGLTTNAKSNQPEEQVAERQRELIASVKAGSAQFAEYLRAQLGVDREASLEAPQLPRKIDPSEVRNPPFELERRLCDHWAGQLGAREASQPMRWTHWHLIWIEQEQFGARLGEAFLGKLSNGEEEKKQEAAVRNLLRRLGGLPHVRGKVSVLSDCPFARAWWRGRVAAAVSSASEGMLDVETAHRILHSNNDAWARLVGDSVRRITVVNHAPLIAALLCQYKEADRAGDPVHAKKMQEALRILARRGSALMFDAMEWSELLDLAARAVAEANGTESDPSLPEAEA